MNDSTAKKRPGRPGAKARELVAAPQRRPQAHVRLARFQRISDLVRKRKLDAAMLEEIEDTLIRADLGVTTAARISEAMRQGHATRRTSTEMK